MSLPEDWRVVMVLSHRPATQDAPELVQLVLVHVRATGCPVRRR
jgi:hypothetical protein